MTALNTHLNQLMKLVRAPGSGNKESLVKSMAALLVAQGHSLDVETRNTMGGIVRQALVGAPLSLRRNITRHLAPCQSAPCELTLSLAQDQMEVAEPILSGAAPLKAQDLALLALTLSPDHTRLIAARPGLDARTASTLVTRQDERTLLALANNHTARIDVSDLARLVTHAARFVALPLPLLQRPDLPLSLVQRLYSAGSDTLKSFIHEAYGAQATRPIQELNYANLEIIDLSAHSPQEKGVEERLRDLGSPLRPALLLKALHRKDTALFKTLLARLTGVPLEDVQDVLAEHGGPHLAKACLAVGLSRTTFETLYLVNRGLQNLPFLMPEDERRQVDEIFANLSQNQALSDLRLCA